MKEINGIDLAHMKSGAHFLFITDTVGLATADAKVKAKVTVGRNPMARNRAMMLQSRATARINRAAVVRAMPR